MLAAMERLVTEVLTADAEASPVRTPVDTDAAKRARILSQLAAMSRGQQPATAPPPTPTPAAQPAVQQTRALSRLLSMVGDTAALKHAMDAVQTSVREEAERQRAEQQSILDARAVFASCQDARLHVEALRLVIPRLLPAEPVATGFLCNAFGVLHASSSECARPDLGGQVIYATPEMQLQFVTETF
jgi:hypothetical protein